MAIYEHRAVHQMAWPPIDLWRVAFISVTDNEITFRVQTKQ